MERPDKFKHFPGFCSKPRVFKLTPMELAPLTEELFLLTDDDYLGITSDIPNCKLKMYAAFF